MFPIPGFETIADQPVFVLHRSWSPWNGQVSTLRRTERFLQSPQTAASSETFGFDKQIKVWAEDIKYFHIFQK